MSRRRLQRRPEALSEVERRRRHRSGQRSSTVSVQLLMTRKEEYAREMTREMGKVLKEARGDVQEAIDMTFYTAGEGRRLHGYTTPSELPNKMAMCVRQPVGSLLADHAVELSDGDSVVEDDAGADLREHAGDQAGGGHAALDGQPWCGRRRRRGYRRG
jgi:hypothetical protein